MPASIGQFGSLAMRAKLGVERKLAAASWT
jgi:hypothetical protein